MKRVIAIVSILSLAAIVTGLLGGMFRPCSEGLSMAGTVAQAMFMAQSSPEHATQTRFQAIDLFIDPNNQPLAAYQLDFHATRGTIRIVGIEGGEGGEHGAFNKAPYYDPKAIQNDHILLAAYSLADAPALPNSRTRIARIHLMIEGAEKPEYSLTLTAAGSPDAKHIEVKAEFAPSADATPADSDGSR